MKYHEVILAFGMLSAGGAMALSAGRVYAETGHHQHHHAMADARSSYQRSVATYTIPDVRLVDMNGAEISLRSGLSGDEPVVLNFIFTSCTAICPVMSTTFQHVQEMLGEERNKVRLVSISIDPENDTPARLREYADKFRAGQQWSLLTGTVADSIAVQRAFGAFRGGKMNHAPATFLRAGGANNTWVRLDGLASASDIVLEYRKLAAR